MSVEDDLGPSTIVEGARGRPAPSDTVPALSDTATSRAPRADTTLGAATSATTTQALFDEEVARTRNFGRVLALICVAMGAFLPVMGGQLHAKLVAGAALATLTAVSLWVNARGARTERFGPRVYQVFGVTAAVTSIVVDYYLGLFSPAPIATTLGIAFFGLSGERRLAYVTCGLAGAGYVSLALAVGAGALPDHGVLGAMTDDRVGRVAVVVMVPIVFGVTLWQARVSRAATVSAVERAQRALLAVGQREAQLQEANQHLDRALVLAKGQGGRHTGARAGRWTLGEILGRGAMGEVYLGEPVEGGERVAVKVLSSYAEHDRELVERLNREGQLGARLASPHIVRLIEAGSLTDGAPYLAMELLLGEDLATMLRRQRTLDLDDAVKLVTEVCAGLSVAHREGVVHRDVKPQNLFLTRTGGAPRWKVIDFGISKIADANGTLTKHNVIGTPGFMSPEQTRGRDVDPRSDLFSLGSVTYRALVGRPAFSGPDLPAVMFDIAYRMPARPSDFAHGIPEDVERVLALALAKRPDDRPRTAEELASAMAAAARGALSPELRARADAVLTETPWGKRLKDR